MKYTIQYDSYNHPRSSFVPYPSIEVLSENSKRVWKGSNEAEADNHKAYAEEKINGSQLTMDCKEDGSMSFYNRSSSVGENTNPFGKAVTMLTYAFDKKNILNKNLTYHGEAVCNLKHNVNVYDRTPKYYFIVYDIYDKVEKKYTSPEFKQEECKRVGLECVPILYYNNDPDRNPEEKCQELIKQIARTQDYVLPWRNSRGYRIKASFIRQTR